jgi:hypothetical protein
MKRKFWENKEKRRFSKFDSFDGVWEKFEKAGGDWMPC